MITSNKGVALIKKFEGFYSQPYKCPAGVPTIGYGTTYYPEGKKRVTLKDKPITEAQATKILISILQGYEADVKRLVKVKLNQVQFDALVSFTYNLGGANLKSSTLLRKININPNDETIKTEFLKWNKAKGKVLNGLTLRREHEANLYFS